MSATKTNEQLKNFKEGDNVVKISFGNEENNGQLLTVKSDSYLTQSGLEMVKIEGHEETYNCKYLQLVVLNETTEFQPTANEIIQRFAVWVYNWTEEDFQIAFEKSRLGWDYYWDRLQGKLSADTNACQAIIEITTNMDDKHKTMLCKHLFGIETQEQILYQRDIAAKVAAHVANHKSKS